MTVQGLRRIIVSVARLEVSLPLYRDGHVMCLVAPADGPRAGEPD